MAVNILIPSAGVTGFFKDSYYPKILMEVNGKPMIQRVLEEYERIKDVHYIMILPEEECRKFHTDNIAGLITDGNCDVIQLKNGTAGALCTSLLAVSYIDNEDPLIIVNNDEIRDVDYAEVLSYFEAAQADAGLITFENIHPRWTYIRTEGDHVVEVAEKKPISRHAVAGFYYFRHGSDFVEAAERKIRKGSTGDGIYYVSGSFNELILLHKKVVFYPIQVHQFHSLYSMEKIKEYERQVTGSEVSKYS